MKKEKKAEIGNVLFQEFVDKLAASYKTKKIIVFGYVQPEEGTSDKKELVLMAHGPETTLKDFSFHLFRTIGKIINVHELAELKMAQEKALKKGVDSEKKQD